jgi:spore germination cell wall hydrolase CwlJ-like protein
LFKDNKARATACALAGGLMLGSGVGLVLGGAYWMGERAQSEVAHARAARLAEAAELGFSQRALRTEMQAMGPGALALAQRQDVFAAGTLRGRQSANVIGQFDARGGAPTPPVSALPSALTRVSTPAEPFHFSDGGALAATRDLACLTDAVYYEARGEGASGQAAVAQVVLNRVRHPAFPKSVCGVVFQRSVGGYGCQFSFACDGSMRHAREAGAWRRAEEIAARALDGAVMSSIGNATHFHVAGINPGWGPNLLRVAQVGLHVFYRFGGSAGRPGSFNGEAQHSAAVDDPTLPTADGAASAGQFILASATTTAPAPASSASAPAAAPTAAPAKVAAAQPKDPAPAKVDAAPKAPAPAAAPAARSASVS